MTISMNTAPLRLRNRWCLLALAGLVLLLGWNIRTHATSTPTQISAYAPDALWALLVFLLVLLVRPQIPTRRAFWAALIFSYAIECSQLYQAPWINQIRDTRLGGLLLGHGFLWSDLVCYAVGIGLGAWIDARFSLTTSLEGDS